MVEVDVLDWLQGHVHADIHINIKLSAALGALFVHEADFGVAGADHVQVQVIGVPPPQREIQLPDVCIVPIESIVQLLLYYLAVL